MAKFQYSRWVIMTDPNELTCHWYLNASIADDNLKPNITLRLLSLFIKVDPKFYASAKLFYSGPV